jgi:hypothetical protein
MLENELFDVESRMKRYKAEALQQGEEEPTAKGIPFHSILMSF